MNKTNLYIFAEHYNFNGNERLDETDFPDIPQTIYFAGNKEKNCVCVTENRQLQTGYYIGIDWLTDDKAIYIQPKLNQNSKQIDFIKMLFSALKHPDIISYTKELYEIKWNCRLVEIYNHQDILTPLLVVEFLQIVKDIVRKGLKKSYYKVEQNLYGRVKGKVLVSQSIKQNVGQTKNLHTFCSYDKFGFDTPENRLIKKTLLFIRLFLKQYPKQYFLNDLNNLYSYIMPAFSNVSSEIDRNQMKQFKSNPIFKEYGEAIRMAKIILKRFGYSLSNIQNTANQTVKTPPFWIDMSRLFELYVLGLLKERFSNQIHYHFKSNYQEMDYLLNTPEYKMVVDAKYKTKYQSGYEKEDIRQLSGYARLSNVYKKLNMNYNVLIDCLIIYPCQETGMDKITNIDLRKKFIPEFVGFYKFGVKLPEI